ncbi:MAG: ATP-binding protein [Nitrospirota bacterium]|jgi:signal transduction histidine kinase
MGDGSANVLLVEDNPGDVVLLRALLEEADDHAFTIIHESSLARGLCRLAEGDIDVVLQDLSLPDGTGLEIVRKLRRHGAKVPIVVLTGLDDQDIALQAVQEGAQDYLVKGSVDGHGLARCIRYAIERERLRADLEEARDQALAAARLKSEFLANVSHELRTPLTAILGFSSLMRRNHEGRCDPRDLSHLDRIHKNGQHLLAMINDLLDLTKIEMGNVSITMAQMSPAAALDQAVETLMPLAKERDIELAAIASGDLPTLWSDPTRVHQILLNLGGNAIKFTPQGRVTLEAACTHDAVTFAVRDTGIGIAQEALELIFDEFRQADGSITRQYGGTGLGLSVSRHLARLLGGDIGVLSQPGEGSTFTLRLPIVAPETLTTQSGDAPRKEVPA